MCFYLDYISDIWNLNFPPFRCLLEFLRQLQKVNKKEGITPSVQTSCSNSKADSARLHLLGLSSAVYYKMKIAKLTHRHRILIGSWENVRIEDCLPIKFRNMICEKDVIAVSFSFLQQCRPPKKITYLIVILKTFRVI